MLSAVVVIEFLDHFLRMMLAEIDQAERKLTEDAYSLGTRRK